MSPVQRALQDRLPWQRAPTSSSGGQPPLAPWKQQASLPGPRDGPGRTGSVIWAFWHVRPGGKVHPDHQQPALRPGQWSSGLITCGGWGELAVQVVAHSPFLIRSVWGGA